MKFFHTGDTSRLFQGTAVLLTTALASTLFSVSAQAAGLDGFDPANLMADENMYGDIAYSMSVSDVQAFLDREGASCVRGQDGSPCLKNATFTTQSFPASSWCSGEYVGAQNESAASVIVKAARACEIAPQVLLVLLQKEQGLVKTTNPTARNYAKATGFACPDTAPCDPAKAGFATQVYAAASRLQQYRLQPHRFNHAVGRTSTVGYNPNKSCGSVQITMSTQATAALYNYTPYVPNAAAIANPYGSGDACSAYGNRNFFRIYSDWFWRPNNPADKVAQPSGASNTAPAQPKPTQPTPSQPAPAAQPVLTGSTVTHSHDLTGDGRADILLPQSQDASRGNGWGNGSVMDVVELREGTRTTGSSVLRKIGQGWNPQRTIAAGDWNSDSYPDLMLAMPNGDLRLYAGRAGFSWASPVRIGTGWNIMDKIIGGSDINGDRATDLIAREARTGNLYLYPGNGRGGFGARSRIGTGWGVFSDLAVIPSWRSGNPAVAGVERTTGRLRVYEMNGRGGFMRRHDLGYDWDQFVSISGMTDQHGDGRGDLTGLRSDGIMRDYRSAGYSFAGDASTNLGIATAAVLSTGRFDHAYRFIIGRDKNLYLYNPQGKEQVSTGAMRTSTGIRVGYGEKMMNVGDWDGEGDPDLMVWTSDKRMVLYPGLGGGRWSSNGKTVGTGWYFTDVIPVRQWGANGEDGLLSWDKNSGELRLYYANGKGGFAGWKRVGTGLTWADAIADGANWSSQGGAQLLARNASNGDLLWIGSDRYHLAVESPRRIGTGWHVMSSVVATGDLTGNGRNDIVATRKDGQLSIYTGTGYLGFGAARKVAL